jgi:ATP-binding cassette, subfamily A (ABC1), member 3
LQNSPHAYTYIRSWHLSVSLIYLPAWIIVALVWHFRIFTATHPLLILAVHLLLGLVLASWSFFVSAPFGKSPQLAAVASTFLAIVFAILGLVFSRAGTGGAFIFSIIFPPGFYIFAIRAICGWENHQIGTNALKGDPDDHLSLLPILIAALVGTLPFTFRAWNADLLHHQIDVFLWPYLAVLWERKLYDAPHPSKKSFWTRLFKRHDAEGGLEDVPEDIAISVKNLNKTFKTSFFRPSKGKVVAVENLSLDIPKFGITVLLGSNGWIPFPMDFLR